MIVILNKPSVLHLGSELFLKSGANEVEPSVMKKWVNNPTVKQHIEDGVIEFNEKELSGEVGSSAENALQLLNVPKAIELVKATIDMPLILVWKENEKRAGVLKAIDAQVKELNAPAKLRSDGESETEELDADDSDDQDEE
jgi:hypothetical protein